MVLEEVLIQFVILALILLLLSFIKRCFSSRIKLKVRSVDVSPFLLLYFIHELTLNSRGFSMVPDVLIIWAIFGLGLMLYRALFEHRLSAKLFYLTLWRIGDVYLIMSWVAISLIKVL